MEQAAAEGLTLMRAPGTQTGWKGVVCIGKRFWAQVYDREAKRPRLLKGSSASAEQVLLLTLRPGRTRGRKR